MAKKRTNVIPIIEDARHPAKYRMLVGMVDVIFSDVAQPDQVWFNFSLFFMSRVLAIYFKLKYSTIHFCLISANILLIRNIDLYFVVVVIYLLILSVSNAQFCLLLFISNCKCKMFWLLWHRRM